MVRQYPDLMDVLVSTVVGVSQQPTGVECLQDEPDAAAVPRMTICAFLGLIGFSCFQVFCIDSPELLAHVDLDGCYGGRVIDFDLVLIKSTRKPISSNDRESTCQ